MTTRMTRALTAGLLGLGLSLAPLSAAAPEKGPAMMDDERMSQMMKMMTEMQGQMRDMQGRMQGMGAMHGQMGQMMGRMGQMRSMMEQHQHEMRDHCPMGAAAPSAPSK